MKIEIDLINTRKARVVIDGRKLEFNYLESSGSWRWKGMKKSEVGTTIGGLIADSLTFQLMGLLQAHIPTEPSPKGGAWGTWETLTEAACEEVDSELN